MAMFQSFRAAPKEDPVDLIKAEIAKAQAEATQLRDRNTNILGAGLLYNKGMGDKSPIYDTVFGAEGAGGGGEQLQHRGESPAGARGAGRRTAR